MTAIPTSASDATQTGPGGARPASMHWDRLLSTSAYTIELLFSRQSTADDSTEARSRERYRRALLTSISALGARIAAILTGVASVPLTVRYLGPERYGMWTTITSLSAFLAFSDLGMANGLMNAVARHQAKNESGLLTQYISSAFFTLLAIALSVILGFGAIAGPHLNWASALHLKTAQAAREAGPAVATFVLLAALNIPFATVQRVQLGLQQGLISNLWQIGGIVAGFGGIVTAIGLGFGTPAIVAAGTGGPLLAAVCNHLTYFRRRPVLAPRLGSVRHSLSLGLMATGLGFLGVQLSSPIILLTDNLIITGNFGMQAVAAQNVPLKLVSLGSMLPMLMLLPLWAAYGEAEARSDFAWIERTLHRSFWFAGGAAALITAVVLLAGKYIVYHWTGPQYVPSSALLSGVAMASFFVTLNAAHSVFLMGTGRLRFTLCTTGLMLAVSLTLKLCLARNYGLAAVSWITAITQFVFVNVPTIVYTRRLMNRRPG